MWGWVIDVGGKCLQLKVVFMTRAGGGTRGWVANVCSARCATSAGVELSTGEGGGASTESVERWAPTRPVLL